MNLVEQINRLLGTHSQELISAGQVVKTMILNGNSTERVAALAMVMGLSLLVYSLGQRALRQALQRAKKTIDNQLVNQLLLQPYVGYFNVLCRFI